MEDARGLPLLSAPDRIRCLLASGLGGGRQVLCTLPTGAETSGLAVGVPGAIWERLICDLASTVQFSASLLSLSLSLLREPSPSNHPTLSVIYCAARVSVVLILTLNQNTRLTLSEAILM